MSETYKPQPHAIEVAAMLGDSVVGVKHCIDPHGGKITRRTWALLAGGITALAISVTAFALSLIIAAANARAFDTWTHVDHKPAHAFRATLLPPAWDWCAFGGLALGLALLVVAIARLRDERRSPYYRIGTAPEVEQPVDGVPAASFPLIAPHGDDFVLHFGPGIDGDLMMQGKPMPFAELAAAGRAWPSRSVPGAFALPIPDNAKIRARAGKTTFLVSSIERPRRHAMPLLGAIESRTAKYFAGSLIAHLGVLLLLRLVALDGGAAQISITDLEMTTTRSAMADHDDVTVKPPETNGNGENADVAQQTQAMKLENGQAGTETGVHQDASRLQIKNNGAEDLQLARQQAIEEARTAGLMGNAAVASSIASIAAETDWSSGFDDANNLGPIDGADGNTPGFGSGLGTHGWGPGGGGDRWGTIGVGKYGVICSGSARGCGGTGPGYHLGGGGGPGGPGHHPVVPIVHIDQPNAVGDLDKSIIRRYVKQNLDKIAYCYEHELLARPDLDGVVNVQFFIQPNGAVRDSNGNGLDPRVANCVAGVVAAIEFPRPSGGGGVQVNYPFTFHAARGT